MGNFSAMLAISVLFVIPVFDLFSLKNGNLNRSLIETLTPFFFGNEGPVQWRENL